MDQFTKLPRWAQYLIVLVVCALIFVIMRYFFLSPQAEKLKKQQATHQKLISEIRQGKIAQKRVNELNRKLDILRRDMELYNSIMPLTPETGRLLRAFQSYARDQNLNIGTISPSGIQKQELYSQQTYKIEVTGGYHNLALFFNKIAYMRRIVNISGLAISSSNARGATIRAKFSALVYMQNPEAFKGLEEKTS